MNQSVEQLANELYSMWRNHPDAYEQVDAHLESAGFDSDVRDAELERVFFNHVWEAA